MSRRALWLWGGLAGALASSAWVATQEQPEDAMAQAVVRAQPAVRSASEPVEPARPARIARTSAPTWPPLDSQAAAVWQPPLPPPPPPPPPAVEAPPPPPAPVAPPFPYQWIGRLEEAGKPQALLHGATRGTAVRAGDVLDGQWRIDRIDPQAMQVTWIPEQKTMTIGYATR